MRSMLTGAILIVLAAAPAQADFAEDSHICSMAPSAPARIDACTRLLAHPNIR